MTVKILIDEKNTFEVEFESGDRSLAQVLAEKLSEDKDVEFASSKVDHPLVGLPRLIIKTKKGDPKKLLLKTIVEVKKDVVDFKKQLKDIVK